MKHVFHKCVPGDEDTCQICNGGLSLCNVCGGAEASLPTDCPGIRLTSADLDEIQSGAKDYVNGFWNHSEEK